MTGFAASNLGDLAPADVAGNRPAIIWREGERRANGRSFEVLLVEPWGAAARELWFDRGTGLLGRMVQRGPGKPLTVELSDYRKVGPLKVAFRFVSDDGPGGTVRVRQVRSLDFTPADRAMFSLPAPP